MHLAAGFDGEAPILIRTKDGKVPLLTRSTLMTQLHRGVFPPKAFYNRFGFRSRRNPAD